MKREQQYIRNYFILISACLIVLFCLCRPSVHYKRNCWTVVSRPGGREVTLIHETTGQRLMLRSAPPADAGGAMSAGMQVSLKDSSFLIRAHAGQIDPWIVTAADSSLRILTPVSAAYLQILVPVSQGRMPLAGQSGTARIIRRIIGDDTSGSFNVLADPSGKTMLIFSGVDLTAAGHGGEKLLQAVVPPGRMVTISYAGDRSLFSRSGTAAEAQTGGWLLRSADSLDFRQSTAMLADFLRPLQMPVIWLQGKVGAGDGKQELDLVNPYTETYKNLFSVIRKSGMNPGLVLGTKPDGATLTYRSPSVLSDLKQAAPKYVVTACPDDSASALQLQRAAAQVQGESAWHGSMEMVRIHQPPRLLPGGQYQAYPALPRREMGWSLRAAFSAAEFFGLPVIVDKSVHQLTYGFIRDLQRIQPLVPSRPRTVFHGPFCGSEPFVYQLDVRNTTGHAAAVSVYNPSASDSLVHVRLKDIMPVQNDSAWAVFDFWDQYLLGTFRNTVPVNISAGDVRRIIIRALKNRPHYICSSRIFADEADNITVSWDAQSGIISGSVEAGVIRGDFSLYFRVPSGWPEAVLRSGAEICYLKQTGELLEIKFTDSGKKMRRRYFSLSFSGTTTQSVLP